MSRLLHTSAAVRQHVLLVHSPATQMTTLTLNNPDKHNAFNQHTIRTLISTLDEVPATSRALILRSTGKSFCAGGDVAYMRELAQATPQENQADALQLATLLRKLHDMAMPTIALVQGPAYGGGVGLVSACDVSVAVRTAVFALSEVKLGLVPATISPYVVQRMGAHHARRYFMTAEPISAERALAVGLVDELVDTEPQLDAFATKIGDSLARAAPGAVRECKTLVARVANRPISHQLMQETAQLLASRRASPEGVEGVAAFLAKRHPSWWSQS